MNCVTFSYYASQKKTLELNPRHPLVKKLLDKVEVRMSQFVFFEVCVMCYIVNFRQTKRTKPLLIWLK